jgi:hypothetical protein
MAGSAGEIAGCVSIGDVQFLTPAKTGVVRKWIQERVREEQSSDHDHSKE